MFTCSVHIPKSLKKNFYEIRKIRILSNENSLYSKTWRINLFLIDMMRELIVWRPESRPSWGTSWELQRMPMKCSVSFPASMHCLSDPTFGEQSESTKLSSSRESRTILKLYMRNSRWAYWMFRIFMKKNVSTYLYIAVGGCGIVIWKMHLTGICYCLFVGSIHSQHCLQDE